MLNIGLLLLFVFGVTPKVFLHEALADHHDSFVTTGGKDNSSLQQERINCGFDQQVVETPFGDPPVPPSIEPIPDFTFDHCVLYLSSLSALIRTAANKGPPAAAFAWL